MLLVGVGHVSRSRSHDDLFPYLAPSMDLVMSFHLSGADSGWLLVEARSPLSKGTLVAGRSTRRVHT